jgi:hypothetical protein
MFEILTTNDYFAKKRNVEITLNPFYSIPNKLFGDNEDFWRINHF